ncbi:MAG: efflux RND transporter periplasmic adaptor subunit [Phycisphaerales bacterium]
MQKAPSLAWALTACACLALAAPGATAPALSPAADEPRTIDALLASQFGELCVLRPSKDAIMSFQQPTKIAQIAVRGGQEVTSGQLLIRGDDTEQSAMERIQKVRAESNVPVEGARAEMNQAEHEAEQQRQARVKGASSDPDVRRAELIATVKRYAFESAVLNQTQEVLQYERMKAILAKFRIEAPFDGIVDVIQGDIGQAVAENEKIIRVVNIDRLWIDVGAPIGDPRTLALKEGDAAWVLLDRAGAPEMRKGTVVEVAPTADLGSRSRRIRVEIENPKGPGRTIAGGPAWVRFTEPGADLLGRLGLKQHAMGGARAAD